MDDVVHAVAMVVDVVAVNAARGGIDVDVDVVPVAVDALIDDGVVVENMEQQHVVALCGMLQLVAFDQKSTGKIHEEMAAQVHRWLYPWMVSHF